MTGLCAAGLTEGSIRATDAHQARCGHEFQQKVLRLTRRSVRMGESVARRRSRVGSSRPKWEIPAKCYWNNGATTRATI